MPEWSNGAVSKTVVCREADRGFESPSLRQIKKSPQQTKIIIKNALKRAFHHNEKDCFALYISLTYDASTGEFGIKYYCP